MSDEHTENQDLESPRSPTSPTADVDVEPSSSTPKANDSKTKGEIDA